MAHVILVDDPRATFSAADVVDEALIEALADLGVAERAVEHGALGASAQQALQQARHALEQARAHIVSPTFNPD